MVESWRRRGEHKSTVPRSERSGPGDRGIPGYLNVRFSNPPMSLMDNRVFAGLRLLRDLVEQRKSHVMVFESDDPEFFIAHLDFPKVRDVPDIPGAQNIVEGWPDFSVWLTNSPCLSIAKVRGMTRGIGNEFICACDMRFASLEHAKFAQLEMGYSLIPGGGGIEWLPQHVGRSRALEIICSAQDFDAKTAELYGWINRALPYADLDHHVDVLSRRIASFDGTALAAAKRLVNSRCVPVTEEQLAESFAAINELGKRQEFKDRYARMAQINGTTRKAQLITPELF